MRVPPGPPGNADSVTEPASRRGHIMRLAGKKRLVAKPSEIDLTEPEEEARLEFLWWILGGWLRVLTSGFELLDRKSVV